MKILSIDVGMRHLAYCICETKTSENNELNTWSASTPYKFSGNILKWDIINLCNDTKKQCMGKTKKGSACEKKGMYCKEGKAYCKTHAKGRKWKIPKISFKKLSAKKLKTTRNADLITICTTHEMDIKSLGKKPKKVDIIALISKELKDKYFEPAVSVNSNTLGYLEIAQSIATHFPPHFTKEKIDSVLIENQMGKMAVRMTILQGMITQHFVEKGRKNIFFVSPKQKLKPFPGNQKTYADRKKLGVAVSRKMFEENTSLKKWKEYFNKHSKRDDLADCFLQIIGHLNQTS